EGYFKDESNLYRPLPRLMFALEWKLAPGNASLSHWINVLLFALSCTFLFRVLARLINGKYYLLFMAMLLYAVHPIHTEVVANIKSRDEILSLLFLTI